MKQGFAVDDFDIQRFLGAIDARTTMLENRVAIIEHEIKDELRLITGKIDQINAIVTANTGGRRAIAWFAALLGTTAALLTTLYHMGVIH